MIELHEGQLLIFYLHRHISNKPASLFPWIIFWTKRQQHGEEGQKVKEEVLLGREQAPDANLITTVIDDKVLFKQPPPQSTARLSYLCHSSPQQITKTT